MSMILKRNSERLQKQLEEQKEDLVRAAGYALLPKAGKVKVINVPDSSLYKEPNGDTCIGYWEKQTGHEILHDSVYYCPAYPGIGLRDDYPVWPGASHPYERKERFHRVARTYLYARYACMLHIARTKRRVQYLRLYRRIAYDDDRYNNDPW